jgi:hypothetical protein
MKRLRVVMAAGIAVILGLGAACTSSRPRAVNSAVHRYEAVDQGVVFDASVTALSDLGYILDRQDRVTGLLTTRPILDLPEDRRARRRGQLSSTGRTRRIAKVRVEPTTETVNVYCRVLVQEQTTQAHRWLADDYSGSDTPTATPIERDAATTRQQNTVWQTIRRDKSAERRILAAIGKKVSG